MEVQVEGYPHLVRDTDTGAIINKGGAKARMQIERAKAARQEKEEIEQLKSDMAEIKDLLKQLLDK